MFGSAWEHPLFRGAGIAGPGVTGDDVADGSFPALARILHPPTASDLGLFRECLASTGRCGVGKSAVPIPATSDLSPADLTAQKRGTLRRLPDQLCTSGSRGSFDMSLFPSQRAATRSTLHSSRTVSAADSAQCLPIRPSLAASCFRAQQVKTSRLDYSLDECFSSIYRSDE